MDAQRQPRDDIETVTEDKLGKLDPGIRTMTTVKKIQNLLREPGILPES